MDRAGILQVGPESAGAEPGPACYGRGGTRPTVTDANVVLSRIDWTSPIGDSDQGNLDIEAARAAVEALGDQLSLGPEETARAILDIVNHTMAGRTRLLSVEQGWVVRYQWLGLVSILECGSKEVHTGIS